LSRASLEQYLNKGVKEKWVRQTPHHYCKSSSDLHIS